MPDHTLFFEPVQSAEGLFIRHQRIRPMDDHQIDIVSTQIFEGVFTLLQDQVSLAGAHILTVCKGVGAFCGDLHFPAPPIPHVPRVIGVTIISVLPNRTFSMTPPFENLLYHVIPFRAQISTAAQMLWYNENGTGPKPDLRIQFPGFQECTSTPQGCFSWKKIETRTIQKKCIRTDGRMRI